MLQNWNLNHTGTNHHRPKSPIQQLHRKAKNISLSTLAFCWLAPCSLCCDRFHFTRCVCAFRSIYTIWSFAGSHAPRWFSSIMIRADEFSTDSLETSTMSIRCYRMPCSVLSKWVQQKKFRILDFKFSNFRFFKSLSQFFAFSVSCNTPPLSYWMWS